MKALPGWLYIVAGAVVAGVAMFVRAKVPGNQAMLYFAIIGFIFLLIGIYRVWRENKSSKDQSADLDRLNMQENINRMIQSPQNPQNPQNPQGPQGQAMGLQRPYSAQAQQALQGMQQSGQRPQQPGQQQPGQQRPAQPVQQRPTTAGQGAAASSLFPYRGPKFTPSNAPNSPSNPAPAQQPTAQRPAPPR